MRADAIHLAAAYFYDRVFVDNKYPDFRDAFKSQGKPRAIKRQIEFLTEIWGGPHLYSATRYSVWPYFRAVHKQWGFLMNDLLAVRWLEHMDEAIDELLGYIPAWVPPEGSKEAGTEEGKEAAELLPPRPDREEAVKHLSEAQLQEARKTLRSFFREAMVVVLEAEADFQRRMKKEAGQQAGPY